MMCQGPRWWKEIASPARLRSYSNRCPRRVEAGRLCGVLSVRETHIHAQSNILSTQIRLHLSLRNSWAHFITVAVVTRVSITTDWCARWRYSNVRETYWGGLLTSNVLVQMGWWEAESHRQTCLSWPQVRNWCFTGCTVRPHNSSVWPWQTNTLEHQCEWH